MIARDNLVQISPTEWEIPTSLRPDMRVPARFFASEAMLTDILQDQSLEQLINTSTLPGVVGMVVAMPDMHEGYGFPIGGIAATQWPNGAISPGGIGYDINCGVRILTSQITLADFRNYKEEFAHELSRAIPSGTGKSGRLDLNPKELDAVLTIGAGWALKHKYASTQDILHTESGGRLADAKPEAVSDLAKKRGHKQLGTLGGGNHFVEVGVVDQVFDQAAAETFGLFKKQITVLIHSGSRGLGHQVATDYIRLMLNRLPDYNIQLPDRELACLPFNSNEGQQYFSAMSAAANFAWVNRQLLAYNVRNAWQRTLGKKMGRLKLLYDVAHNIAKIETHTVAGQSKKVIVHRKGATRAFAKGSIDLPADYMATGQPVLLPGSMGSFSYILVGAEGSMQKTFGSACHGAGRKLSRHAAMHLMKGWELRNHLLAGGIIVKSANLKQLPEEAPYAYKDIDEVVDVVHEANIARRVARLRPLVVIKG